MIISNVILSLLSFEDLSGYDIKKKIQDSRFFPWTGNNNQVYKALTELLDKNYVSSENILQSNAPTKKVYSITAEGREQLKVYAKEDFGTIQLTKPFIIRLMSSVELSKKDIEEMMETYKNQLLVDIDRLRTCQNKPYSSENLSEFIITKVNLNELMSLEQELKWLDGLEKDLNMVAFTKPNDEPKVRKNNNPLTYEIKDNLLVYNKKLNGTSNSLSDTNIKEIIISVIENNVTKVVIEGEIFTRDSLSNELIENMTFEFNKYNIDFELV